jgi:2-polyprenyl-6-hydroxyphenyl methylase/3-demethylubiquinone-9 3-methyltransferase
MAGGESRDRTPHGGQRRSYYAERLSAERLRQCYDLATPRVRQYLRAEIDHVLGRTRSGDRVLELGCGYGRVARELRRKTAHVFGIDTAIDGLVLARRVSRPEARYGLVGSDATNLSFTDRAFDVILCVQNGICAFGVDPLRLVQEAIRVCRPGGRILFSSYAAGFWPHRLEWFELQAARGLVGAIDRDRTGDGVIVCRDGFRAACMGPAEFRALWSGLDLDPSVRVVDESAVFCETVIPT